MDWTIQDAKDLIWLTPEQVNAVDCNVKFACFDDYIPYTATSYDTEPHGILLYQNCINGVYGPIAPYVPPASPIPVVTP